MLEIIFGGAQTTVQDLGRSGQYRYAICPSGAQDNFSFRIGNILLKNRENAAALEITMIGPKIKLQKDTVIVFTGADISPKVNGIEVELWKTIKVNAGDVISFGQVRNGCRAYLCIAGGINVPVVFGSRSTGTLNKIGGYKGRKLMKGDIVDTFKSEFPLNEIEGRRLPEKYLRRYSNEVELRFIAGGYEYKLTEESLSEFFRAKWTVSVNSSRVAYYLDGPEFEFIQGKQPFGAGSNASNVVDIAYPVGSVQIPGGKHPVLLLNDAVTGGGFAIIGAIVKADLDIAGQLKPGDNVLFRMIDILEALQIRRGKEDRIKEIKKVMKYQF
jgi:biotin-dependent carboxylase-like uncharacterized protein